MVVKRWFTEPSEKPLLVALEKKTKKDVNLHANCTKSFLNKGRQNFPQSHEVLLFMYGRLRLVSQQYFADIHKSRRA